MITLFVLAVLFTALFVWGVYDAITIHLSHKRDFTNGFTSWLGVGLYLLSAAFMWLLAWGSL